MKKKSRLMKKISKSNYPKSKDLIWWLPKNQETKISTILLARRKWILFEISTYRERHLIRLSLSAKVWHHRSQYRFTRRSKTSYLWDPTSSCLEGSITRGSGGSRLAMRQSNTKRSQKQSKMTHARSCWNNQSHLTEITMNNVSQRKLQVLVRT